VLYIGLELAFYAAVIISFGFIPVLILGFLYKAIPQGRFHQKIFGFIYALCSGGAYGFLSIMKNDLISVDPSGTEDAIIQSNIDSFLSVVVFIIPAILAGISVNILTKDLEKNA
jgi:uncharacterized membrane protein